MAITKAKKLARLTRKVKTACAHSAAGRIQQAGKGTGRIGTAKLTASAKDKSVRWGCDGFPVRPKL